MYIINGQPQTGP